jgi:hypothetical protein
LGLIFFGVTPFIVIVAFGLMFRPNTSSVKVPFAERFRLQPFTTAISTGVQTPWALGTWPGGQIVPPPPVLQVKVT